MTARLSATNYHPMKYLKSAIAADQLVCSFVKICTKAFLKITIIAGNWCLEIYLHLVTKWTFILMAMDLSIIVPISIKCAKFAKELATHYLMLLEQCQGSISLEVLIADNSDSAIYELLEQLLYHSTIIHFRPSISLQMDKSNKLNNIHAAFLRINSSHVLVFDDDVRPTLEVLSAIKEQFKHSDYLRCMITYPEANIYDLIDLAGVYVINITSPLKQFWGNMCFKANLLSGDQFPKKNILFDDLCLELQCRKKSKYFAYLVGPPLPMAKSSRNLQRFIEQRIRYAYENIVFRLRFCFFLSILPLLITVGIIFNIETSGLVIGILSSIVLGIAHYGQTKYGKTSRYSSAWLYAPLWFWFYPFTSWIALGYWWRGGIYFGPHKLRNVI